MNDQLNTETASNLRRRLSWLVLGAAILAASLAGVRTLTAEDLGYHLAFGEQFWTQGLLVDHVPDIYTLPPQSLAPDQRPEPGPGCWYDTQGRYRFPNANWLTQVIFYAAWAAGGVVGLNVLLAACVAGLFVLIAGVCIRAGGGPLVAAAAVLLSVMIIFPRLMLRPELLGYLALLGKAMLLAPVLVSPRGNVLLSRRAMIGVIVLQLLYVNLHSYWMLGLALTGVALLPPLAIALSQPGEARAAAVRALKQRSLLLGGQILVCFVNPWTWRLAVLPVQTLLYMRRHNITGGVGEHPWNVMLDLQRTKLIPADPSTDIAGCFFVAAFVVLVAAVLVSLFSKRWGAAAVILGMLLVAFSAERNMAVGVLAALPIGMAILAEPIAKLSARLASRVAMASSIALAGLLTAGAVVTAVLFVRSTLYRHDLYYARFGSGFCRQIVPVDVADAVNDLKPTGRLWATPQSTSSLYFLVRPHPPIQMITNTWAYPPATMAHVNVLSETGNGEILANRWDISVAAITPGRLFTSLRKDGNWTLVRLADGHGIFIRKDGPDAALARMPLQPEDIDVDAIIADIVNQDASPTGRLLQWADLLTVAGFHDRALTILDAARPHLNAPGNALAVRKAAILTNRGMERLQQNDPRCVEDLRTAGRIFAAQDGFERMAKAIQTQLESAEARFNPNPDE